MLGILMPKLLRQRRREFHRRRRAGGSAAPLRCNNFLRARAFVFAKPCFRDRLDAGSRTRISMKIAVPLLTIAGALTAPALSAAELRVDENVGLTELLTGLDVLDTQKFDSGLQVRLYRTGELKECEAGREAATCPRGQLLVVALVIQGSSGAAMMWRSSPEIGWQFVRRIDSVGTGRTPGSRTFGESHLEVSACEAEPGGAAGVGRETHYRLSVSLENATLLRIPGDTPTCEVK
jgi:hypothetical protein